ncbi:hypothetical protein BKI52_06140 [marine bacterium AO1-C]|nr:hypothetical protein BKI52_06140 [marine bacterium AO1-C]
MSDKPTHSHFELTTNEIKGLIDLAQKYAIEVSNQRQMNKYLIANYESLQRHCRKKKLNLNFNLLSPNAKVFWLVLYFFRHKSVHFPKNFQILLPWPQNPLTEHVQSGEADRFETLLLIELIASRSHQSKSHPPINLDFLQKALHILLLRKTYTITQQSIDFMELAAKIKQSIVLGKVKKLEIEPQDKEYQIPDSLAVFTRLDQFVVHGNFNHYGNLLAPSLFQHKKITEITLRNCQLNELLHTFRTKQLSTLHLPQNKFTKVPQALLKIAQLHSLSLASNQLIDLPQEFTQLEALYALDLSGNQVAEYPAVLLSMENLTEVNLQNNRLETLPQGFEQYFQQKRIDLRDNWLQTLPNEVELLFKKSTQGYSQRPLLLLGNPLESLPEHLCPFIVQEIKKVPRTKLSPRTLTCLFCWAHFHPQASLRQAAHQKLEKLLIKKHYDLMSQKWRYSTSPSKVTLFKFAYKFGELLQLDWPLLTYWLKYLYTKDVFHIDLTNIGAENIAFDALQAWPKLRSLRLSKNPLQKIDVGVTALPYLQKLYLDRTSLAKGYKNRYDYALPLEISHMEKLTQLDLQENYLQSLPPGIGLMDNLQTLNIRSNWLSEFPAELCELDPLETLDVSFNKIATLPTDIVALLQLKKLYLNNNCLQQLPVLPASLEVLDLNNNQFESFPQEILSLPHLQILKIQQNPFNEIPEAIGQLTNLKELWISKAQNNTELEKWLPRDISLVIH